MIRYLPGLLLLLPLWALALDPGTTDARAIVTAVDAVDEGDRQVARLSMVVTDRAGRQSTKTAQLRAMEHEGARRQLVLFESPADLRGAGLLSIDWEDGAKVDDQWLYLPSLGRATRIASTERSGAFMGSDLTYADMTRKDPDAYDYTLVDGGAAVDGEPCWIVEARPRTDKEKQETGYLKTHTWISKSKLIPLQTKSWVIEGQRLKYTQFKDVKSVSGRFVPHQIVVRTMKGGELESSSTLTFTDLRFDDPSVVATDFTEARLARGL